MSQKTKDLALEAGPADRQKRSAATRQRILKVVARAVSDGSYDLLTVQDIAGAADCSVGGFYGRFKSRDDALFALLDRRCAKLEKKMQRLLAPGGRSEELADILGRFVGIIVDHTVAGATLLKTAPVAQMGRQPDGILSRRARAMNNNILDLLAALLERNRAGHAHPQPRMAAQFVIAMTGGLARDGVLHGSNLASQRISPKAFKAELTRAVLRYLGVGTE